MRCGCVFFFKQKTAYEMRISDWSSDVCSSDLRRFPQPACRDGRRSRRPITASRKAHGNSSSPPALTAPRSRSTHNLQSTCRAKPTATSCCLQPCASMRRPRHLFSCRSEEHTSELQSLMRISYAVFCLKHKKKTNTSTEETAIQQS